MKNKIFSILSAAVLVLALGSLAKADSYTMTYDHCSGTGGCLGGGSVGTVTVTQDGANTVQFDIESTGAGMGWAVTGAGTDYQFFFNISGNPTISASFTTAGWELVSTTPTAGIPGDGYSGDFAYAVTCHYTGGACPGGGTSSGATPPLVFTISTSGLTPGSFINPVGDGAIFVGDVLANGNTGLVGFTGNSTPQVPEPGSLALFGTGILGMAGYLRRKLLS